MPQPERRHKPQSMRKEFFLIALFLAFSVAAQLPIATYREGSWSTLISQLAHDSQTTGWWGSIFWPCIIALIILTCFLACWLLWERAKLLGRVLFAASGLIAIIVIAHSVLADDSSLVFTGGIPLALLIVVTRTQRRLQRAGEII